MAPAWALREDITFHDALCAALAASLDLPLATGDRRLGRAPRLPCRVEVVGAVQGRSIGSGVRRQRCCDGLVP